MIQTDQTTATLQPAAPPRKKKHVLAWALVLLVCLVLLLPLLHRTKTTQETNFRFGNNGNAEVNVATAAMGSMEIYLDALGTVTPENTVNVYSLVSGRVLSVAYREGQMVEKGQLLAEIDPRPYEAQLKQAEGTLKRDQAALEQARVDLKRYQEALQENALAQQTVFDQEQTVKQYEGSVQNDEGAIEYDKIQLGYCKITAPISGRIGLRLVDPGNTIFSGSSSTIGVITQLNPITVVFSIPEDRVLQVQKRLASGETLKVDLYDRSQANKLTTGKLLTLDNAIDTTTGTVRLRAVFDNASGALFPNQFVNARLRVDTLQNALLIPTVAIQYNGQQAFVYKIGDNNTATLQNITLVNSEQSQSAIQGLKAGERIITSNFDRVEDGAQVTIAGARTGFPGAGAAGSAAGGQGAGAGAQGTRPAGMPATGAGPAQGASPAQGTGQGQRPGSGPAQGPGSR
jgi:membrane fusion protein, multidrug efflux system